MDFTIDFVSVVSVISIGMLVWACVEVGSNDATNLVNAVFGSRVMKRKLAVTVAGFFVILGAMFASPVMDTVRKGIFDVSFLNATSAVSVFIAAYFVNTVLLYTYSGYGLPVSTTATLVYALAGGAIGVSGNLDAVNWETMSKVTGAIFLSIAMSGFSAFLVQRMFRGAIRKDAQQHDLVLLHGPWITGLILVALFWFMIVKGMKGLNFGHGVVLAFGELGTAGMLFSMWVCFSLLTYFLLKVTGRFGSKYLFHFTAVLGMCCMAFAFGQNDLANCASPGLAVWMIWKEGLIGGSSLEIPMWTLFSCGFLMYLGMRTKRAQRVTRAEINTASQYSKVKIYAPNWCLKLASFLCRLTPQNDQIRDVAPEAARTAEGKKLHYDALRASVILAVSASVIALASSLGLPVSTTYVGFAAVIATGWGDRVFSRGRSDLKLGRAIWVVTSWFMGAFIAAFSCAIIAFLIYRLEYFGLLLAIGLNLGLRYLFKERADQHEKMYHTKTKEKHIVDSWKESGKRQENAGQQIEAYSPVALGEDSSDV